MVKKRIFFKIKKDTDVSNKLKSLFFKHKEGYFVDINEEIYISDKEDVCSIFEVASYNNNKNGKI